MENNRALSLVFVLAFAMPAAADARCHRAALDAAHSGPERSPLAALEPSRSPYQAEPELGSEEPTSRRTPVGAPASGSGVSKPGTSVPAESAPEASHEAAHPVPMRAAAGGSVRTPLDPGAATVFSVAPGETLRTVLTRWAGISGWQVVWEAPNDYSLSAPASFSGPFPDAVTRLVESLEGNGAPYGAELYTGNRVVRVTRVR